MKFEKTYIGNLEGAIRGLRNPLESWNRSDSLFGIDSMEYNEADWQVAYSYCDKNGLTEDECDFYNKQEEYAEWLRQNGILRCNNNYLIEYAYIGPNDLDLAHRMIKPGTSDSKFLRQIDVCVDITAPLYWWKEMDQYRIGVTTNSTSTMHKLATTPITINCFEIDDYNSDIAYPEDPSLPTPIGIIRYCEHLRKIYNETKDKRYWKELIRWLPESWLQKRTTTMNYAVLRNIYFQRLHHKLSEWQQFCNWIESLPYANDLIIYTGKEELTK